MAAPSATARSTPTGLKLRDGYQTLITFARFPAVNLWEKTVTPPGMEGGDSVDTTTMFNDTYETRQPAALRTMSDASATVAYDPAVLTTIQEMININDEITFTHPDGSTWAVWGYLQSFVPQEHSRGSQPEAEITIVITCEDNDGNEQDPVVTSVSGT